MITEKFKAAYYKLNQAQKEAVDAIEGSVMVIAGPGTGKTQILTTRIANILLKTDTAPESILALTFTESGVNAMRKRLVNIIGTPGYRVHINTFHGFCNELIKNNPEDFSHFISSNNADEVEKIQIIENIIDAQKFKLLKPWGDPYHYVKGALSAIDELKKEGITVEKFGKGVYTDEQDFQNIEDLYHEKGPHKGKMKGKYETRLRNINKNKELYIIYSEYQKEMQKLKLYDYADMLIETIKAFEINPQLLLRMQEQYQYFLVDEHQDTNAAQNKIIELLCNYYPNPNLFVVGDEKQSIYRFQGASLENFLYFKKLYPEAVLVNLKDNYRSCQTILDASGELIKNNLLANKFMPENASLNSQAKQKEQKIKIIEAHDYYSEYYAIAEVIKQRTGEGIMPNEIAILARNNRDLMPFTDILEQQNIPYIIDSGQNLLQDNQIQKIILLFRAVYNLGDESSLIKAMHLDCLEINPIDIVRLVYEAKIKQTTLWDILTTGIYKSDSRLKSADKIEKFYNCLTQWKTDSYNERFDYLFKSVIDNSGLIKSVMSKKNALQNLDNITGFYENLRARMETQPNFSLEDFMQYLTLLEKHEISLRNKAKTTARNRIRLMTAHASKGLEFDLVFILNAYDGHWGNARNRAQKFTLPWDYLLDKITTLNSEEKNEDERRLFYVALTRARKEIIISYSLFGMDGKDQIPSQFIEEILNTYKELEDIEEFEKKFLDNKQIIISALKKPTKEEINNEYLANKDLFQELFMRKGFAATHLSNYLECPWKYFYRNLLELPDVKTKSLMYGTAIHQAINSILMKNDKNLTSDSLIKAYYNALSLQPFTPEELAEAKEKGIKALKSYYEQRISLWEGERLSELNIKGIHFSDKVKLTGKIDMIEKIKGSDNVIVTDFKTGKPKTRNVIGQGDYKRQLVFYKILIDRYQYHKMKMLQGVIDFVEPDDNGECKKQVFDITDEEVKALEEQIKNVTEEILNLSFWDKGCKKPDCEYCMLRSYIGG